MFRTCAILHKQNYSSIGVMSNFSYVACYFMPKIYGFVTDRHCSSATSVGLTREWGSPLVTRELAMTVLVTRVVVNEGDDHSI